MSGQWNNSGESSAISLGIRGFAVPARQELTGQVDRLYEEHYESVYRYLVLTGSHREDADEVVQEAFLRLLLFLGTGHGVEKPRNWLLRVSHNIRLDQGRRENRRPGATDQELANYAGRQLDPQPNPESAMLEQEKFEQVRTALKQLTGRQSEFLLLRAEGMKLREIAEMHGVTVQSVAESCSRAMEKLGRLIND